MNLMLKLKRREFVMCLVDVASVGMSYGMLDEADTMVACIRQLRPRLDHLDLFDGWIAILRGDWIGASHIARSAIERTGDWPFGTAMLALCQYATGDPIWANSAEQVLSHPHAADAKKLMRLLLGRIDAEELGIAPAIVSAIGAAHGMRIENNFVLV